MEKIELIQYFQLWTRGEIEQGKWMIVAAVLLIPIVVLLFKSGEMGLGQGMAIPISFLLAVNLCYGTYLLAARGTGAQKLQEQINEHPAQVLKVEYKKAQKDNNIYKILRLTWVSLGAICAMASLFFLKEYSKGISLGFAVLFMGLLVVDTFLHNRNIHLLNSLEYTIQR
ncbi:uncharacterized protein CHSO_3395 [Chryseobacterium sp. StRB126]|uniref:hypothetical protein n=1 Tax=Chryseobacterium sp. StRB126 TaxID=878220 RepID=UPI0004E99B64|nr:hypothetical protein [Chryseobacterium sp. StRB126]BAP32432.1 uncharacterized protein CHSO_3395 [Chryseobacterium sp. StRB126]